MRSLSNRQFAKVYEVSAATIGRWRKAYPALDLEWPAQVFETMFSQHSCAQPFGYISDPEMWAVGKRCEILIMQGVTKIA